MYVVEKKCGGRTYVDYFHNQRFRIMPSAKNELKKMFEEQEKIGGKPEWLNEQQTEFIYSYQDKKIKVYIKEEKKCVKPTHIMCYSIKN